jgi:hypothetical protein
MNVDIYKNGTIKQIQISNEELEGKSAVREKLFASWSANELSEDEKRLLADLHIAAIIKGNNGASLKFVVYQKDLYLLNSLKKRGFIQLVNTDVIIINWLTSGYYASKDKAYLKIVIKESQQIQAGNERFPSRTIRADN